MHALQKMTQAEFKLALREPIATFFTLVFPVLILFLFGSIYGNEPSAFMGGRGSVDNSVPGFTSIVMHLEAAEQALPDEATTVAQHIAQAKGTARDNLGQARRVVEDLRPEVLESTPLDQAIARVVQRWSQYSGIAATFQMTGDIQTLHTEVEVTLLRAAQEALANVRKHARASEAQVTLSYLGDVVILDMQDNGRGFVAENGQGETATSASSTSLSSSGRAVSGGFGLVAMRERVDELNGELVIESDPAEGTTLMVSIPTGAQLQ